ncbi:hypothetical protein [Chitinophaga sp. CF418]|uniref:hypothetical protein n=1 Tax=Chitinophaga sp. CF418 TaxID=1855287 RepID=UPI00091F6EF8|nr:hypothetical protein [Chitinophaga sp. CF418]SHN36347.1 hypothetical protein SAMN05216311_11086 [Chitinophaga sp. CF418]
MTTGIIIGLMAIVLIIVVVYRKRIVIGQTNHVPADWPKITDIEPDSAVSFGYKCVWFAVRTDNKNRLAEVFALKDIFDCNWKIGIDRAYNDAVFITPTIDNWTLAVGWGLPYDDGENGIEKVKDALQTLSKEFGEAQFFCTHRVSEYHCWMKAANGDIVRIYNFLGEAGGNTRVEGKPTEFEQTLKLANTLSDEAKDPKYFDDKDLIWPDEDLVMQIAGHWSIDPTQLEFRQDIMPGLGLLGRR